MAYDKNRGRAAGTPGFYRSVGQKHTHGENTGEWTREERARRSGDRDDFRPRREEERRAPYAEGAEGRPHRDEGAHADYRRETPRPPRVEYGREPAGARGGFDRAPARGTRNRALSPDRPIYADAFEDAPRAPRPMQSAPRAPHPAGGRPLPAHPAPARPPRPAVPVMPAAPAPQDEEAMENLIVGRNPIREAVKSGRDIERILVQRGELSGSAREIIARARERRIVVQEVDKSRLDAIYANHQGMIAYASAAGYSTVDDMLALARERGEDPFLIVLDGITDPHNLGAIIRTAECAGAHGVILQQRRSVGLTPAAVKAAAGAAEYMKVAKVVNITRTLAELKSQGIWVIGADMDGQPLRDTDLKGAAALVIGAEGEGISRLVRDECDLIVSLPMRGHIQSLNASVAAGVLMYAVRASRGD